MRSEGVHARNCNICGFVGYFKFFGWPLRFDACCPQCGSLERHRLFKLWLAENVAQIENRRILHLAPEACVTNLLKPLARHYTTADILPGRADRLLDIENVDLESASMDVVICSHVLEHVDDRKALAELRRILRPGGMAILLVPIAEGWSATFEDCTITTPEDRALYFGQHDHVRFYGADFRDRVRKAGFTLTEFTAFEPFVSRHGLIRGEKIFLARCPD